MWAQIITSLIMMVISAALRPSTQVQAATDQQPGKLDVPTPEEGRSVPVIFGTVIVKSANVAWYGDSSTTAITSQGGGKK